MKESQVFIKPTKAPLTFHFFSRSCKIPEHVITQSLHVHILTMHCKTCKKTEKNFTNRNNAEMPKLSYYRKQLQYTTLNITIIIDML